MTASRTPDERLQRLCDALDVPSSEGEGYVRLLPVVDALRGRGFVVVLKWDGEREPSAGDSGQFTAVLTGGDLAAAGESLRSDAGSMEQALTSVLASFAVWWEHRR
jgi:hypothetical protein